MQLEQMAIGVDYMDVYQRCGHYPMALPYGLGLEGAGTITAAGDRVSGLKVGDRVAYGPALGA